MIIITIWAMFYSVAVSVTIAKDYLVVVVHPDNPVKSISVEDAILNVAGLKSLMHPPH